MNPLIQFKTAIMSVVIAVVLGCFAFSPAAQAAPRPETPDPGAVGGALNTADGTNALHNVVTGAANSAFGWFSLASDISGSFNTGCGAGTLIFNNGDSNTAIGAATLLNNTTGVGNTAVGVSAGINQDIGSNNIYIGDIGVAGESNVIAIGNAAATGTAYDSFFTGGVFDAAVDAATAVPVLVDAGGKLGTVAAAANGNTRNKATVPTAHGAQPQAMLNELRKEQKRVAELEETVARLAATVKKQASQIQKVSAQIELSKRAPQTVLNNH
jgi:hypothetical protein